MASLPEEYFDNGFVTVTEHPNSNGMFVGLAVFEGGRKPAQMLLTHPYPDMQSAFDVARHIYQSCFEPSPMAFFNDGQIG